MGSKGRRGALPRKRSQSMFAGEASGGSEYCHAPSAVLRVDVLAFEEHAILYGDCRELAGAHSDEGKFRVGLRLGGDRDLGALALRMPEIATRRVQIFFPRVGADDIAEERVVVAPLQAVGAALLLVRPAGRQIFDAGDVVIDDRLVANGGAANPVAGRAERGNEGLQSIAAEDDLVGSAHKASSRVCVACPR